MGFFSSQVNGKFYKTGNEKIGPRFHTIPEEIATEHTLKISRNSNTSRTSLNCGS